MNKVYVYMAKARATADAIDKKGEKTHGSHPTVGFAQDYNSFLVLVGSEIKEISSLLPPQAFIDNGIAYITFAEMGICYEQIYQILASLDATDISVA